MGALEGVWVLGGGRGFGGFQPRIEGLIVSRA